MVVGLHIYLFDLQRFRTYLLFIILKEQQIERIQIVYWK